VDDPGRFFATNDSKAIICRAVPILLGDPSLAILVATLLAWCPRDWQGGAWRAGCGFCRLGPQSVSVGRNFGRAFFNEDTRKVISGRIEETSSADVHHRQCAAVLPMC